MVLCILVTLLYRMCREMVKYVSADARKVAVLRRKMQAVEIWADRRKLSHDARRKIRAFYAEIWMSHAGGLHGCNPIVHCPESQPPLYPNQYIVHRWFGIR